MGKRKSEAFNEAIVGLFMVVVVLLLAYFTIVISGVDIVRGDQKVMVRVVFDQVGGLKNHDNVMYRGTKVGKVERVEVTASNLVVHASVDRNVILRESCQIFVRNLSMLGGNFMMLEEGEGARLPLEGTLFRGVTPTDWMQDVSSVAQNLKRLTEMAEVKTIVTNVAAVSQKANEFMDRAKQIADKAQTIVDRVERGEGTVGKLLSSDASAYDDFRTTLAEAKEAVVTAKVSFAEVKGAFTEVKSLAGKLNRDETVENLHAGVAAFRKAAESLDLKETVAKADALMANLNDVALKLKNGEGTLGRLATDEKLYEELNGLIRDVRQVLDNYRDTTPITTFSSLATGAL